jgi:hypothetical protein
MTSPLDHERERYLLALRSEIVIANFNVVDPISGVDGFPLTRVEYSRENLSRQEPFVKQVELLLYLELTNRCGGSILDDRLIVPVFKDTSVRTLRRALFL